MCTSMFFWLSFVAYNHVFERNSSFQLQLTSVRSAEKLKQMYIDYFLSSSFRCFLKIVSQVEIPTVAQ